MIDVADARSGRRCERPGRHPPGPAAAGPRPPAGSRRHAAAARPGVAPALAAARGDRRGRRLRRGRGHRARPGRASARAAEPDLLPRAPPAGLRRRSGRSPRRHRPSPRASTSCSARWPRSARRRSRPLLLVILGGRRHEPRVSAVVALEARPGRRRRRPRRSPTTSARSTASPTASSSSTSRRRALSIEGVPLSVALREDQAQGGDIKVFDDDGVIFRLCGLGPNCAIDVAASRRPSATCCCAARRSSWRSTPSTTSTASTRSSSSCRRPRARSPARRCSSAAATSTRELERPLRATLVPARPDGARRDALAGHPARQPDHGAEALQLQPHAGQHGQPRLHRPRPADRPATHAAEQLAAAARRNDSGRARGARPAPRRASTHWTGGRGRCASAHVRLATVPWLFRLPWFRRFAGYAMWNLVLLRRARWPRAARTSSPTSSATSGRCSTARCGCRSPTWCAGYRNNPYEREARRAASVTAGAAPPPPARS